MATPQEAQIEVMDQLREHFDRSPDRLSVEQVTEMTGLDDQAVKNALRVLKQQDRIQGIMVDQEHHPIFVTGLTYF